ncbi:hypothetical protein [Nostoc sp.]|uniref:hypothetical protein n=1 Tax=Nostoc sp. TaxID=1180 RepID=UPI002FFB1CCC
METKFRYRDYSLVGPESVKAVESGLSCVQWYRCPIERQQLKELMKRRDMPALRDTALWFILIITAGAIAYVSWGSWFAVPTFLVYGWLYGGASDSRWHKCSHGTAFKTRWMNDALYQIASFMVLRESTLWFPILHKEITMPQFYILQSMWSMQRLHPDGKERSTSESFKMIPMQRRKET